MESNNLRIFQMVAYEGSISKAALRMGYVQSNVTLRIKALEKELDTTLLIRHNKGVILTDSGKKLLAYAERITRLIDEAEAAFKSNYSKQSLKIGATQTISASVVPRLLGRYSEKYPDVILSLKTDNQKKLIELVVSKELDGAFINGQCEQSKVQSVFSFEEELAIISSIDTKDMDELLQKPIIINNNIDCPYRAILERWVAIKNGTPSRIMEVDSLEAIIRCVEDDMGISLLPKGVIKDNDKVYIHELSNEFNKQNIHFIRYEDSTVSHQVNNFICVIKEAYRHLNQLNIYN